VPANVLCEPRAPFITHIVDFEGNAGRTSDGTAKALVQDDVERLIDFEELVLQGSFAKGAEVRHQLRVLAGSAEDVRGALEQREGRRRAYHFSRSSDPLRSRPHRA